jgi:hypothetical protein
LRFVPDADVVADAKGNQADHNQARAGHQQSRSDSLAEGSVRKV